MTDKIKLGFKRINENATLPTKAHATDSGLDLYAADDVIIEPGKTVVVPTGIAVQLPEGTEAQVRPRSGVTSKTKLRVQLGTIDNGYTGEIGVIVDNVDSFSAMFSSHIRGIDTYKHHMKYYAGKGFPNDGGKGVSNTSYIIRKGDRIAQLVVQNLPQVEAVEVEELSDGERGSAGFGSTGVREANE